MKKLGKGICSKGVIVLLILVLSHGLLVFGQPSYPPLWSYKTGGELGSVSISSDGSFVVAVLYESKEHELTSSESYSTKTPPRGE